MSVPAIQSNLGAVPVQHIPVHRLNRSSEFLVVVVNIDVGGEVRIRSIVFKDKGMALESAWRTVMV